jgi:hypothetical protein
MAILDMFGRPIEKGDLVLQLVPRRDPFLVQEVIEPSLLNPDLKQVPTGELRVSLNCGFAFQNPARVSSVMLGDWMIVMKNAGKSSGTTQ